MRIAIIVGSKTDLKQCLLGLQLLEKNLENSVTVFVRSQHRNTLSLQQLLRELPNSYDIAIVGAGWANHLTGCVDAFLRYEIKTTKMPVVGVAFADCEHPRHTRAAKLSMTEVPGTQVIYQDDDGIFVGEDGFLRACRWVMLLKNIPVMEIPDAKPGCNLSLSEAIQIASE
ncbi:MAG: AIR carboxylase family protein [Patescibacteria group bacterium]